MIKRIRYILRKGKYGYYYHDNEREIHLSLRMVLNKLNLCENNRLKYLKQIKNLKKEIFDLTNIHILKSEIIE